VAVVAALVLIASIVLFFVDRKMLWRMLTIFGATIPQMAVVFFVVLLINRTNAWWAYLILYLLTLFLSICWVLYPLKTLRKKALVPVCVAMLTGGNSTVTSLILALLLVAVTFVGNLVSGAIAVTLLRKRNTVTK